MMELPSTGASRPTPSDRLKPTAGIVLAAGMSSRFGEPKQLVALNSKPALAWVLDACLASMLDKIYLVLGHAHQKIIDALAERPNHPRISILINPDYQHGQSTSLRAGVKEIKNDYPSAMFLLGDQPLIKAPTLDRLLATFWASSKSICVPTHQKTRGNPVIFSNQFYDAMLRIHGDMGARQLLSRHPDHVLTVDIGDPAFFHDIDTPDDLARVRELIHTPG